MKSPSLDRIHDSLNRQILLAQSYTEVNELFYIIKTCRLKPYSYFFEEKKNKLTLYKWWFDEFGNSLKIIKNKRIKITYNDLFLNKDKIVCTDLYYGLTIDKISKISKLMYLFAGKDDVQYQDCFVVTFLGLDNYLRTYIYSDNSWQQVSPLVLGMRNLKLVARHTDIKYFKNFSNKENMPIPCVSSREWITFMPPSKDFIQLIEKQYDTVFSFLH